MRRILAPLVAASLTACAADTSSPAVPEQLVVVQGGGQVGTPGWPLDSLIIVRVVDDGGIPMAGVAIIWSVFSGGGRADSATGVTADDGTASARWILGTEGTDQGLKVIAGDLPAVELLAEVEVFRATAIAVGSDAACALDLDGLAWCWGSGMGDWNGEFSSPLLTPTPTRMATDQPFTRLVGGNNHWCALTPAGRAWCWSGQYPVSNGRDPASMPAWTPGPVEGAPDFVTLGAGQNHTCGIEANGQAWCWGMEDSDPRLGGYPFPTLWSLVQVPQAVGVTFVRITGGWEHTCAVATDGSGWCWGRNDERQFGDSTWFSRTGTPIQVDIAEPIREIAAGDFHSCAVTVAGHTYCWGQGYLGALGIPGLEETAAPRLVSQAPIQGLAGGWQMTRGIRAGVPVSWGQFVRSSGFSFDPPLGRADAPTVESVGVSAAVEVSGQRNFACARLIEGEVYCWGEVPGIGRTMTAVAVPLP